MTPEACFYGGVLTGGLLKATEEEGFTFVTQNVTHTIRQFEGMTEESQRTVGSREVRSALGSVPVSPPPSQVPLKYP